MCPYATSTRYRLPEGLGEPPTGLPFLLAGGGETDQFRHVPECEKAFGIHPCNNS